MNFSGKDLPKIKKWTFRHSEGIKTQSLRSKDHRENGKLFGFEKTGTKINHWYFYIFSIIAIFIAKFMANFGPFMVILAELQSRYERCKRVENDTKRYGKLRKDTKIYGMIRKSTKKC